MDSLRLGLLAVEADPDRISRLRRERASARQHQRQVLSWIADKNLNNHTLAAALNVTHGSVCAVLNGQAQLPPRWIEPLATLLDVTPEQLTEAWQPWHRRKHLAQLTYKDEYARLVLVELLCKKQMTQIDLARAIGVQQPDISGAVRGRKRIPLSWYEPMATLFDVPVDHFKTTVTDDPAASKPSPRRRARRSSRDVTKSPQVSLSRPQDDLRQQLAQFVQQNNLTQKQAAEMLGTQQPVVSRALSGKGHIPAGWVPIMIFNEK